MAGRQTLVAGLAEVFGGGVPLTVPALDVAIRDAACSGQALSEVSLTRVDPRHGAAQLELELGVGEDEFRRRRRTW